MPTAFPAGDPAAAVADLPVGPDMTRYLVVCLGLVGLVLALAWFFRRFVATSVQRRAAKRSLRVVDVLPLGGKKRLAVVNCYDRCFLIGLGEKEVTSIAELDQAQSGAAEALVPGPGAVSSSPRGAGLPASAEVVTPAAPPFAETLADALEHPAEVPTPIRRAKRRWKDGKGILG